MLAYFGIWLYESLLRRKTGRKGKGHNWIGFWEKEESVGCHNWSSSFVYVFVSPSHARFLLVFPLSLPIFVYKHASNFRFLLFFFHHFSRLSFSFSLLHLLFFLPLSSFCSHPFRYPPFCPHFLFFFISLFSSLFIVSLSRPFPLSFSFRP